MPLDLGVLIRVLDEHSKEMKEVFKYFYRRWYDMNMRSQMQGGKNLILLKEMNANCFFRDSHWMEIWSNCEGCVVHVVR
jgi:hypothetical protein